MFDSHILVDIVVGNWDNQYFESSVRTAVVMFVNVLLRIELDLSRCFLLNSCLAGNRSCATPHKGIDIYIHPALFMDLNGFPQLSSNSLQPPSCFLPPPPSFYSFRQNNCLEDEYCGQHAPTCTLNSNDINVAHSSAGWSWSGAPPYSGPYTYSNNI